MFLRKFNSILKVLWTVLGILDSLKFLVVFWRIGKISVNSVVSIWMNRGDCLVKFWEQQNQLEWQDDTLGFFSILDQKSTKWANFGAKSTKWTNLEKCFFTEI